MDYEWLFVPPDTQHNPWQRMRSARPREWQTLRIPPRHPTTRTVPQRAENHVSYQKKIFYPWELEWNSGQPWLNERIMQVFYDYTQEKSFKFFSSRMPAKGKCHYFTPTRITKYERSFCDPTRSVSLSFSLTACAWLLGFRPATSPELCHGLITTSHFCHEILAEWSYYCLHPLCHYFS